MESINVDQAYLTKCSEKTLQSKNQGFFLQFADHVADVAGKNWIKNVFGKLKTDKERIKIIYEHKPVKDAVIETLSHVQEIYRKKNGDVSFARRSDAEKAFQKGDLSKALIFSCQSVLRSPTTGEDPKYDDGFSLAAAFWLRSKILMELKKYSYALSDVQSALKEGLADEYRAEAFWKMAICYRSNNEINKAKVSFAVAEKLLGNDANKIEKLREDMKKVFSEDTVGSAKVLPNISGKTHPDFPNASHKLSLKEAKEKGRYFVAKEKISTGETVAVEAPYASCLLPECFGTHCHHCFERLISPVGCTDCSSVAFCKSECRDIAMATYHKYECHYLDLLIGSGMSILSHTALRMITQNSLSRSLEIYKNKAKERVYSLCTNSKTRSSEDFLQRTLMAAFLLRCLQRSGYFLDGEANDDVIPLEEEICIAELLLYHLQMLQFNAHEIYETRRTAEHKFKESKSSYIGVAVYPTVAFFNHDCYPAVTRYFVGRNIVITTVRPLDPGEIVGENYGPLFTRKPLVERQKILAARYWFKCQCQACVQNWPGIDTGLENVSRRLRCPNTKCQYLFNLPLPSEVLNCPKCKKKVSMTSHIEKLKIIDQQYEAATEALHSQEPAKGIAILCEAIDNFHKISSSPHRETQLRQEMLRVFLADSGNLFTQPLK